MGLLLSKSWPGLVPWRQTSQQPQHLIALETDPRGRAVASWREYQELASAPGQSVLGEIGIEGRGQASAFTW